MLSEASGIPVGGGTFVAAVIYTAASLFVTGPVVGERTIARSNWASQCKSVLRAQIKSNAPQPAFTPKFDCNSILGLFGSQGKEVCRKHGNPTFNLPMLDQLHDFERRKNAVQRLRLAQAASQAGSRCECAISATLEKRRVALAIYAGSARLVTPPSVKHLKSELITTLHSQACALKGER